MQIVGLIFATLIGTAIGLTCYNCNSFNDTACDDFFSAESEALRSMFVVKCPPATTDEKPFCRKTKMYLYNSEGTSIRVYRECGYGWRHAFGNKNCYPIRSEDYDGEVCQCYGDNCNGASHTGVWAPLLVVGAVMGLNTLRVTV